MKAINLIIYRQGHNVVIVFSSLGSYSVFFKGLIFIWINEVRFHQTFKTTMKYVMPLIL